MQSASPPPARWWHALDNGKIACRLCPRECHIPRGSRGFCFVRANVDGRMELTTYGRSSGFCIDPIEKKPLNHFLPGTPILSFGTAGCNLGCKFCQNWDISKSRENDKLAHYAGPEAIVEAAIRAGCRSLAFTYNDPIIWAEYAIDIAKVARARGLRTVAVTAGYITPEARGEFYQHMDAANVDLKAFTDGFYSRLCQVNLEPILDSLKFLKRETSVWFELTNLMIPGENDSPEETRAMCGWIVENLGPDVPVHFTAFHPDFKMRDRPPTPPETLVRARAIAHAAGIRFAYVGNVNDVANQSTYCPECKELLIQRDWHALGVYRMKGNRCGNCGTVIPGLFDDTPGAWGRRREAIAIDPEPARLVTLTTNETRTAMKPQSAGAPVPQIDFTAEQDTQIAGFTRAIVESTVRGELFTNARLPDALAQAPAYGIFVSLHRGDQLRSCKGQWGGSAGQTLAPLGQMLGAVARDSATNDPRFPQITGAELPFLDVEISLMHSPQHVAAKGDARIGCVEVGRHGLVIAHPRGRGLLLPQVAVEAGWDALTFLQQVCRKAGLPADAWREEQAHLMTFCARKIDGAAAQRDLDAQELGSTGLTQLFACAVQALRGPEGGPGLPTQAEAPALHRVHAEAVGVCLQTPSGANGAAIMPGSTLLALARLAGESLAASLKQRGSSEAPSAMTLLWQPLTLSATDYPSRHQLLANCAVLAEAAGRWSLIVPRAETRSDPVAEALRALQLTPQQWRDDRTGQIRLTAFKVMQCQTQGAPAIAPGATVRRAFRAGTFYPAAPATAAAEIESHLRAGGWGTVAPQAYRAIMLPHAGWRFCGSTMGKTLARVALPRTAIIVGPRHTPLGADSSVGGYSAWEICGAHVPVELPLVQRLARAVPGLACETEAHRQEHGTEVLLPFLLRLRPDLRIVPLVLGRGSGEMIRALAAELAGIRRDARARGEEAPLLVISSDMNHFAADAENRRRDGLALEAMAAGNPQQLYEVCIKNQISMCGLLPAVVVMQALLQEEPVLSPRVVDYTTSAAASGDTSSVVGYAGVVMA